MKNEVIRILRSHLIEIRSLYNKYIREDEIDEIANEIMELIEKETAWECGTDWAGLDPVKWKDVGKRKYIIFGDTEDTNITPQAAWNYSMNNENLHVYKQRNIQGWQCRANVQGV